MANDLATAMLAGVSLLGVDAQVQIQTLLFMLAPTFQSDPAKGGPLF